MADDPDARAAWLALVLPNGTDRWIALFDGDPTDGGVELTVDGYSRVAHSAWTTLAAVGKSTRANVGLISFSTVNDAASVSHWAIYDADVDGVRLQRGPCLNDVDEEVVFELVAGDWFKLGDGSIEIVLSEADG